jgi:hypothetical protein
MRIAPIEFRKLDILDMNSFKAVRETKWGVNDFQGRNVIPFDYDSISKVTELLFLEDRLHKNDHYVVIKKNKFGVLNSSNNAVIKVEYDSIGVPRPCSCPAEYVVTKNGLSGITDYKGKLLIPLKYASVQPFQSAEVTLVKTVSGKEGYVRRDGMEYFVE